MSINIIMFRNKWPVGSIRRGYTHPFHPIPAIMLLVLCIITFFAIFLGYGSQLIAMVGPNVQSYNDTGLTPETTYFYRVFAFNNFAGGVRVGATDIDGDGRAEIVTGAGPGLARFPSPRTGTRQPVKVFQGLSAQEVPSSFAIDALFAGGLFVAGF